MINFVHIGNNTILSVHKDLEARLRAAGFDGNVEYVEFVGIKNSTYPTTAFLSQSNDQHILTFIL